jgi:alpha-tubulin suppressor-like RCC1 family protein
MPVTARSAFSIALKSDGSLVVWGDNGIAPSGSQIPAGISGLTAISASEYHALALTNSGAVVASGTGATRGTQFARRRVTRERVLKKALNQPRRWRMQATQ